MSEFSSRKVRRNIPVAIVVILVLLFSVVYYAKTDLFGSSKSETFTESSAPSAVTSSSLDTNFTTPFSYGITIIYNGSWSLVYWDWGGFGYSPYNPSVDNTYGNRTGSGNYSFYVYTYGVGYNANTLCANATKLNPQSNLMLTLEIAVTSGNTTTSDPTATACMSYGI